MSTTVILGAGIIGVSAAYYLSEHQPPSSIHLVEASPELFASASGFAGGFLAKDWFSPAVASLGRLSYDEHRRLAESKGGRDKWGYSGSTSLSYTAPAGATGRTRKRGDDWLRHGTSRAEAAPSAADDLDGKTPSWLRRRAGDHVELIADDGTTAQVDPLELSRFLLGECLERGVRLHQPAQAVSVHTDVRGELASVRIADTASGTETDLPCTRVVIAAGAWSRQVFKELFRHTDLDLPIGSLAGHSLVLRSPRWAGSGEAPGGCHAVYTTSPAAGYSPEIFSRLGGQLYVAGLNSAAIPLPRLATEREVQSASIAQLRETARELLGGDGADGADGESDDLEVLREGLCFRPVTPWGAPIVCRIADEHLGVGVRTRPGAEGGVFVAAGHGPWGISLSLGTGLVLAEMAQGRAPSADVSSLGLRR